MGLFSKIKKAIVKPFKSAEKAVTNVYGAVEDTVKGDIKGAGEALEKSARSLATASTAGIIDLEKPKKFSGDGGMGEDDIDIGVIGSEEAQQIAQMRLARMGKYFAGGGLFGAAKRMFGG